MPSNIISGTETGIIINSISKIKKDDISGFIRKSLKYYIRAVTNLKISRL